MERKTAVLLAAACVASVVVAGIIAQRLNGSQPNTQAEAPQDATVQFDKILDDLVVSYPEGELSQADRRKLADQLKNQQRAKEQLRRLGTNVLPRLLEEVRIVGRVEATNRAAAESATRKISQAFEVLGTNARPLLPTLIYEFHTGRSIGPSMAGIVHIGGADAGLSLVPGLTNSDPMVRNWTMSGLSSFATNREVALAATPFLLQRLHDDSAFSRALASSVIGSMHRDSQPAIQPLVGLSELDADPVVRISAIKAIARFGTNAAPAKTRMHLLATGDPDERVRRMASLAIQAIEGKIRPEEVQ